MTNMRRMAAAILISVSLWSCSKQATTDNNPTVADAQVTGAISLAGQQNAVEASQLEISLTDVSADDGSVEIAKQIVPAPRQFPFAYALRYQSDAIQPQHRYTMSARLLANGRPQWVTDTAYAVITQRNPLQIDMHLVRTGENSSADVAPKPATQVTDGELPDGASSVSYRAYFEDTQLVRIDELRGAHRASYEFTGARLRHYFASEAGVRVELGFDEHGKLLSSTRQLRGSTNGASSDEVNSVRNRAELLRSHALAQREIKAHAPK